MGLMACAGEHRRVGNSQWQRGITRTRARTRTRTADEDALLGLVALRILDVEAVLGVRGERDGPYVVQLGLDVQHLEHHVCVGGGGGGWECAS